MPKRLPTLDDIDPKWRDVEYRVKRIIDLNEQLRMELSVTSSDAERADIESRLRKVKYDLRRAAKKWRSLLNRLHMTRIEAGWINSGGTWTYIRGKK